MAFNDKVKLGKLEKSELLEANFDPIIKLPLKIVAESILNLDLLLLYIHFRKLSQISP